MGNAGPFVVKYPGGDVAAEGVLARLDPTLKPARESRLRVVKEDLSIFVDEPAAPRGNEKGTPPQVGVEAGYTIENPTDKRIDIDFGFPILRGTYLGPDRKDLRNTGVWIEGTDYKSGIPHEVISDSFIYGIIRRNAREIIEKSISSDAELLRRIAAIRTFSSSPTAVKPNDMLSVASDFAREDLRDYLTGIRGWNQRDAALLVAYTSLDLGESRRIRNVGLLSGRQQDVLVNNAFKSLRGGDESASKLISSNLGVLAAIGEQKATQFFAHLASCFDKNAATKYEAIFAAWGGDVRERSVDLASGKVRPRGYTLPPPDPQKTWAHGWDPTIYARVDYLDPDTKLTAMEKSSCQTVLKNLPVVFTFAPMSLLYYQISFPAKATRVVTVSYIQSMYTDDRGAGSYQLAYVLHPASLWDNFGPIQLTIQVPKGIACRASVPIQDGEPDLKSGRNLPHYRFHRATLTAAKDKMGELFIGIDKAAWDRY
jgi:hypothetical protein